jgi:hypothetical protein
VYDHKFENSAGTFVPTSQLTTSEVQGYLDAPFVVFEPELPNENVEDALDRLRIELLIRSLGL